MSYIRSKEIPPRSGNWYDYEVMGVRKGKKVRQKVIRYIGKSSRIPSQLIREAREQETIPVAVTP